MIEPSPGSANVGIYDRPASADRPRWLMLLLLALAVIAAAAVVMFVIF